MMPGETGLELTRALRESRLVPILLLTAMGEVRPTASPGWKAAPMIIW